MAKTELALADKELSILDVITLKKEELTDWVKTADSLIVTPETLKEADTFRKKGKNFRLEIQSIAKGNNDKLNKLKKINSDREDEFILKTGLEAAEKRLDARIKVIEDAIEADRQAKLRAEDERKRKIKQAIADIENKVSEIRAMTDIKELNLMIASIEFFADTFEEFNEEGNAAIKQTVTAIENRVAILEDERELKQRREAKITSRKEMLANYPQGYWPTDEQIGAFTQEEFEEAIVIIEANIKADQDDEADSNKGPQRGDSVQMNGVGVGKVFAEGADMVVKFPNPVTFETMMHGTSTVNFHKDHPFNFREETLSDSPERKFQVEVGHELNYSGYEVKLSANFPAKIAEDILDFIKGIIDELPV